SARSRTRAWCRCRDTRTGSVPPPALPVIAEEREVAFVRGMHLARQILVIDRQVIAARGVAPLVVGQHPVARKPAMAVKDLHQAIGELALHLEIAHARKLPVHQHEMLAIPVMIEGAGL